MKRTAKAIAGVVLWLGACGGGTLGGNGGMVGTLTGAAGVTGPGSGVGGAAGAFAGFGGDIAPRPGGNGGGIAGRGPAGRGGTVGRGGGSGTCPPPAAPVCGTLCGNGKIDSCERLATGPCPTQTWKEECDGADLGADSCTAYGYPSGQVTCSSDCTQDLSTCSVCVPGPSVFSCGPAGISSGARYMGGLSLAATDTEVAVATVTFDPIDGNSAVGLVRLSSALSVQHNLALDDTSQPGPLYQAAIYGAAVAPIPTGWVVAICSEQEMFIHAVDATTGVDLGRTVVSAVSSASQSCSSGKSVLAARPGGGPLLLWQTGDGLTMSMIAADGLSASPPQTIVSSGALTISSDSIGAAWVGDAFAVAVAVEPTAGTGPRTIRQLRVLPDGTPRFVGDSALGDVGGGVRVVTGASEVRIVYNGGLFNGYSGIIWWRLAADGASPSPVLLGNNSYSGESPGVAFGDDTLVLMGSLYLNTLSITRVAADGHIVTPPYDIVLTPDQVSPGYEMVRRGPEAVVAWYTIDQVFLARVSP